MKNILLIALIFFSRIVMGQPSLVWQHCTGGTDTEGGIYVTATHDHGFIVTGMAYSTDGDITNNHGIGDVMIIRFDSANNIVWQKTYGGSAEEGAQCIIETSDHGFVFAAGTESNDGDVTGNHGDNDIWIVKIDSVGNIVWQKTFGDVNYDEAFTIIQNTSGNFIVLGWISDLNWDQNFCLLNIDQNGNLVWQKSYGGSDTDWGYEVIQTLDGGYMLSGYTYSADGDVTFNHGDRDVWLVKTDNAGDIQWQKTYGGTDDDYADNILQLANGQYVFAAAATSDDGDVQNSIVGPDYWIVKTDVNGNIVSQKCYGGSDIDEPYRIIHTSDNGFLVTGQSGSNDVDVSGNHGLEDCWTLKLDSNLNRQWAICSGGSDEDLTYGVWEMAEEDYVLTGYTFSNNGDVSGNHGGGYEDAWTFRLSAPTSVNDNPDGHGLSVYPNPAEDQLNLSFYSPVKESVWISLYDVHGRCLAEKNMETVFGENKMQMNLSEFDPGIFTVTLKMKDRMISKMVTKYRR